MTIETRFDIPLVAALALREKQIQQHYRPIIAVHKWFARRPGTLFRALTLAEFGDAPLADLFFTANEFRGRKVADPFMGGGTPLIEANRVGCDVTGFDINPMAWWIVREAIEHIDLAVYERTVSELIAALHSEIGSLYHTDCPIYGDENVPVKYFLWVKVLDCAACGTQFDLFPGYLLSEDARHPKNVLVCADCGELNEVADRKTPGRCQGCRVGLRLQGPASRSRCACPHCGCVNRYPRGECGPPQHRLFAIEYHNPEHKATHKGRFFKKPDAKDLARFQVAEKRWHDQAAQFAPTQEILPGDETNRLHRWGYTQYRQMFNARQLLGLELSCRLISEIDDERVRRALATNFSDLLRYQNMLCRYNTWALKSLDIFSVHGFPVGLIQCESNLFGISNGKGANIGSGGWHNIAAKYAKAKRYCDEPFEVCRNGTRKYVVPVKGEWIGEQRTGKRPRTVTVRCASATAESLAPGTLDAVFTDPPYFGNVQYGELMDFCYAWLRRLIGDRAEGFHRTSTRSPLELTGNATQARGLEQFAAGLSEVYQRMARALKPGAPLVFTYHHNKIGVYHAAGVAILDAGLTCSATLSCPAEMAGSIHIHGTASSIVDTVFVCRSTGTIPRQWLFETPEELVAIVAEDREQLGAAGYKPTLGDIRCIIFGHLTRMAIWNLRREWCAKCPTAEKLHRFAEAVADLGDPDRVSEILAAKKPTQSAAGPLFAGGNFVESKHDAVCF